MLLVQRVKSSVTKRRGAVIFRADLDRLGGPTQVGLALKQLISDGVLVRLGEGIYSKAFRDAQGKLKLAAEEEDLIKEVLIKLGIDPKDTYVEDQGSRKRVIVDTQQRKVSRHLVLDACPVEIISQAAITEPFTPPNDPACLPRRNVGKYIEALARTHRISSKRTGLDRWTEAVSRAAGDVVQLDSVGRLLAKLKEKHVINGKQMAHLMNNYMTECQKVGTCV